MLFFRSKIFRSSEEIEADKILDELFESFIRIIKQREEKVETGQSDNYGADFLGSLLEGHLNADENARISIHEIIEECKTFYFAGHKTVTSLLSWSLYLLAIHTDWQEKARNEVAEFLGQENPTTENISKLKAVRTHNTVSFSMVIQHVQSLLESNGLIRVNSVSFLYVHALFGREIYITNQTETFVIWQYFLMSK